MGNFCINCGAKLRREDNFCSNCGAKIDKSYMKQNNHLKSDLASIEKENAKKELQRVVGGRLFYSETFKKALRENGLSISDAGAIKRQIKKEIESGQIKSGGVKFRVYQFIPEYKIKKEEEKARKAKEEEERKAKKAKEKEELEEKLKLVDIIFESEEIQSKIRKNNISEVSCRILKSDIKKEIINKKGNMIKAEIKFLIRTKLEKLIKQTRKVREGKKMRSKKTYGGYCSLNCRHCYEEFFDSGGALVGDFDIGGYTEYYCNLGHSAVLGHFCEDYE